MKALRFICLIQIILLSAQMLFGATLVSLVDARRTGGTGTGTFVNNELPSFLLAPVSRTFGIRNTGTHPAGQWQFAVGAGSLAEIKDTATINLTEIASIRPTRDFFSRGWAMTIMLSASPSGAPITTRTKTATAYVSTKRSPHHFRYPHPQSPPCRSHPRCCLAAS